MRVRDLHLSEHLSSCHYSQLSDAPHSIYRSHQCVSDRVDFAENREKEGLAVDSGRTWNKLFVRSEGKGQ